MIFTLFNGFKLVFNNEEIETLKFDNYNIEFPNIAKKKYKNFDKNTVGIFSLLHTRNETNTKIIIQRIFDIIILISFISYFYFYAVKSNNYTLKNILLFIILSVLILLIDNFTENFNFNNINLVFINTINILSIHFIGNLLKIMKLL